jgi:hypothetical protein
MRLPLLALSALAALVGCSLTDDEPLAPGTFEVSVTGDVEVEHAGGPVWVAAPDSGLNVTTGEWRVYIPVVFESDLDDGDGAEVRLSVYEPHEPDGPFLGLPDGTFMVSATGEFDPTEPSVLGTVRTERVDVSPTDGTLRLRRTAGGVEGEMEARYAAAQFNGEVFRGRIRLRFHALAERPEGADER